MANRRYRNAAFLKALGKHCRKVRVQQGYSMERLHLEANKLSMSTISRLETGRADVQVSVLLRYADVIGVPVKKLLDF